MLLADHPVYLLLAYVAFLTNLAIGFATFTLMLSRKDTYMLMCAYGSFLGITALDS